MVLVLAEDSFGWGRGWFWLWLRIVLVVAEHGFGFGRDSFDMYDRTVKRQNVNLEWNIKKKI